MGWAEEITWCYAAWWRSDVRSPWSPRSPRLRRAPVKGADVVVAHRIAAVITIQDTRLRLDGFALTALVGQTQITISPGIFNGPKPSLKQSVALARIAAERVAALRP